MKNQIHSSECGRRPSSSNRRSQRARSKQISGVCAEIIEQRLLLSTYTVNTTSDAINPGAGLLTLRQAVADANSNPGPDTIAFSPTVFTPASLHTITLTQGEITFADTSGATTVTGPGSGVLAVSGDGASRVFQLNTGVTVALSGLEITGGNQSIADSNGNTYGGGIYNAGTLTLTNSVVSGNSVVASANTTYTDNYGGKATISGMGLGGAIDSTGPLTITNSQLSSNSVTNTANGAPVFVQFTDKTGVAFGGAVYSVQPLVLNNDIIDGNSAVGTDGTEGGDGGAAAGGGIYAAGTLTVTASTVSGNKAAGGTGYYSGYASGGGLFASAAVSITNSIVSNNSVSTGFSGNDTGGSAAAQGGGVFGGADVSIAGSTISSNAITVLGSYNGNFSGGGGVYAVGTAELTSDTIDSNTVAGGAIGRHTPLTTAGGGGVYAGGLATVLRSTISGNAVTSGPPNFSDQGGASVGGGIDTNGGGSISYSTFAHNSATGGAGYSDQGNSYDTGAGGNGYGGGIYNAGFLTITNSTLAENSAAGGAGGDSDQSNGFTILPANGGDGVGGGTFGAAEMINCTVTGNSTTAGRAGRGFDYLGDLLDTASPGSASAGGAFAQEAVIVNSIISGNTADGKFDDLDGSFLPAESRIDNNLIGVSQGPGNGVDGNIVGVNNPRLSPLGNYGGPTETMPPLPGSPAIDTGNNGWADGLTTDQRGLPRIVGKAVDIGAVEFQASIFGTVFNDTNGNGKLDPGESGIGGVTVYIDVANAGVFKAGDPETTTKSSGNYSFTGLVAGTYIVRQVLPTGDKQTFPTNGFGNHVTVSAGQTATNANFGDQKIPVTMASISGEVFNDANGIQNSGELGLSGWTVYIDLTNSGTLQNSDPQTTTDSSGDFTFSNLTAGTYILRVISPTGWSQTLPTKKFGQHITLATGQKVNAVLFGEKKL